jgi:1,4-alpha-glucan branching enzyme
MLVVCNFTPEVYKGFELGVPYMGNYKEVFNTDDEKYGGSGYADNGTLKSIKETKHGRPQSIKVDIAPLATMYFKIEKTEEN